MTFINGQISSASSSSLSLLFLLRSAVLSLVLTTVVLLLSITVGHFTLANIQPADDFATTTANTLAGSFAGVSRDVLPFCSSRPSLPISLAMMVVHIKRDISFNYKLYLLSDNYVFQTGQVIPRDDFKIHAFPAKVKRLSEFWPNYPRSFMQPVTTTTTTATTSSSIAQASSTSSSAPTASSVSANINGDDNSSSTTDLTQSAASPVATTGQTGGSDDLNQDDSIMSISNNNNNNNNNDPNEYRTHNNRNKMIHDSMMKSRKVKMLPVASFSSFDINTTYLVRKDFDQHTPHILRLDIDANSFEVTNYVNITDRDIHNPTTISSYSSSGLMVESELLHWDDEPTGGTSSLASASINSNNNNNRHSKSATHHLHNHEDYAFLNHPILADVNTRIMAITQIYEEWITRNYYTIVYVERRMFTEMPAPISSAPVAGSSASSNNSSSDDSDGSLRRSNRDNRDDLHNINAAAEKEALNADMVSIYDRLIFRGASTSLLAADQMDYPVEAAAFITEKNKLHYWLEFLAQGENRFQLRAIEWAAKPFKVHSSRPQQQPQQQQQLQPHWQLLDNEELLLCPPSICYAYQPIDEIIDYGYIPLPPTLQTNPNGDHHHHNNLVVPISQLHHDTNTNQSKSDNLITINNNRDNQNQDNNNNDLHARLDPEDSIAKSNQSVTVSTNDSLLVVNSIKPEGALHRFRRFFNYVMPKAAANNRHGKNLQNLVAFESNEYLKQLRFDTKLHLRDWIWPLHVSVDNNKQQRYEFKYDEGHRNPIKARTDNYGYIVTGHNIDASFRVFNEIYLISANLLITINYTQSNESVITKTFLYNEYPGLNSTIDDPITAAYYDRYHNQVYFIKGDRYLCYDFTNKSLQARFQNLQMAPVMSLIGHQVRVDAIYHSISSDIVYVFVGMRYYTYRASEFTDGYTTRLTVSQNAQKKAPTNEAKCINSRFFKGCHFDKAYRNPCQEVHHESELFPSTGYNTLTINDRDSTDDFYNLQQLKIRNLASLSQSNNKLIYNPDDVNPYQNQNLSGSADIVPIERIAKERHSGSCASQAIITYLTILSILLASIIAIILVVIISNWRRIKLLLAGPTEPYLDRAALNKVKNFPLSEPELSNSSL